MDSIQAWRRSLGATSRTVRQVCWGVCAAWTGVCLMGLWAGLGRAQSAYQETAVAAMACANILAAYVLARCVCALLRSTE